MHPMRLLTLSGVADMLFDATPRPPSPPPLRGPMGRVVGFKVVTTYLFLQLFAWPTRPRTALAWVLALVVILPVAWLRWRFPNPLLYNPIAARIEARTRQEQPVSGERLGYLLAAVFFWLTLTGAVLALAVVAGPRLAPFFAWLAAHFH